MMNKYLKNLLMDAEIYDMQYVQPDREGKLPEGDIVKKDGYNYLVNNRELSEDEIKIALLAKQTIYIKSIKNIVLFYFILTLIGIAAALIMYFV